MNVDPNADDKAAFSRKLVSSIQWAGESWQLYVARLALPTGGFIEKGLIRHPGAVVLVPLQEEQILMIRQYRLALDQTILELPAGTREADEEWLPCAQRELREETGYRAAELTPLGAVWPAPGLSDELMQLYLATELTPDPLPGDVDEEIEVVPMSLDELIPMALDGRLQDGKSVVGILRAAAYLGRFLL